MNCRVNLASVVGGEKTVSSKHRRVLLGNQPSQDTGWGLKQIVEVTITGEKEK